MGDPPNWCNAYLWWDGSTSSDVAGYFVYRKRISYPSEPNFRRVNPQQVAPDLYWSDPVGCAMATYEYYVVAVDTADNESAESNHVFLTVGSDDDLIASVDAGTPQSSPYTQRRAGYYAWGGTPDSTVDYDPDSLVYRFTGLDADSSYAVGIGFFQRPNTGDRRMSFSAGGLSVHGSVRIPPVPVRGYYKVPRQAYRSGTLSLVFKREQGPDVVLAGLALYQVSGGGGPQGAGQARCIPRSTSLLPPRPNPATGSAEIGYHLSGPSRISLAVYDVLGRRVRSLVEGSRLGGAYSEVWDGRDECGLRVRSGVYFVRLQAGGVSAVQKLVLSR